jgi:hypothetical protein
VIVVKPIDSAIYLFVFTKEFIVEQFANLIGRQASPLDE